MNTELHMASAPRAENPEDTRNHCQPRLTGGCSTQPTTKRICRALSLRQAVGAGAPDLPQQAPGLQQSLVPHPLLLRGLRTNCVVFFFSPKHGQFVFQATHVQVLSMLWMQPVLQHNPSMTSLPSGTCNGKLCPLPTLRGTSRGQGPLASPFLRLLPKDGNSCFSHLCNPCLQAQASSHCCYGQDFTNIWHFHFLKIKCIDSAFPNYTGASDTLL